MASYDPGVTAPLAPEYRETPYWWEAAPPDTTVADTSGPDSLPNHADVVIVGAGYCGVMAARELARRGRDVAVLEADALGYGASTRNGGMVIPELKHSPHGLETKLDRRRADALLDAVDEAFDLAETLAGETGGDYRRTGGLMLATGTSSARTLTAEAKEWSDRGVEARYLARDELAAEVGTDAYEGGLLMERTGGLHPAKFHTGLLGAALDAGARFFPHTRARTIERSGAGFRIDTDRGSMTAGDVLAATNATADGALPWLRKRVLPVGSFIIATEELDPQVANSVIPGGRMLFDTKNFLNYWRLSPDGRRVLYGGRASLSPTTIPRARDFLYQRLTTVHPQLEGTKIEFAWGGDVAITYDRLPHFGRIPDGPVFAAGCNGTGVALQAWMGVRAAGVIAGDETSSPFAAYPFPKVPAHALRGAYLPFVGLLYKARDRIS